MDLAHRTVDDADLVEVSGRIDATTAKELEATLTPHCGAPGGAMVLDFSRVDYISSAGLRALLIILKTLAANDRRLAVAGANADVLDVLRLTGFDKLVDCHPDVESALSAAHS